MTNKVKDIKDDLRRAESDRGFGPIFDFIEISEGFVEERIVSFLILYAARLHSLPSFSVSKICDDVIKHF